MSTHVSIVARPKIDVNLCVFKTDLMQISAHISWEIMQFNAARRQ